MMFNKKIVAAAFGAFTLAIAPQSHSATDDFIVSMDVVAACTFNALDIYLGEYVQGQTLDQAATASNVNVTCGGIQTYNIELTSGKDTLSNGTDNITYSIRVPLVVTPVTALPPVPLNPVPCVSSNEWNTTNTYDGIGAIGVIQHLSVCYQINVTSAEAAGQSTTPAGAIAVGSTAGEYQDTGVTLTLTSAGL